MLLAWIPAWAQTTLSFGGAAEDVVSAGQVRRFLIQLDAPAALHLKVDHGHLDLQLRIRGPDGAVLGETANFLQDIEPLTLTLLVDRPGLHQVEISLRGPRGRGGRFRIALGAAATPTPADRLRIEAEQLRAEADQIAAAQEKPRSTSLAIPSLRSEQPNCLFDQRSQRYAPTCFDCATRP